MHFSDLKYKESVLLKQMVKSGGVEMKLIVLISLIIELLEIITRVQKERYYDKKK